MHSGRLRHLWILLAAVFGAAAPLSAVIAQDRVTAAADNPTEAEADAAADEGAILDPAEQLRLQAEQAAARARVERDRLIAAEREKLEAVQEGQEAFSLALDAQEGMTTQIVDDALGWRRRVREIADLPSAGTAQADALYPLIVTALEDIRAQLRQSLSARTATSAAAIDSPALDEAVISGIAAAPELVARHSKLAQAAIDLKLRQDKIITARQLALREAMELVNQARLDLIPSLSPARSGAVLGFGAAGIAQAQRELSQIELELRYQWANWRLGVDALQEPFRHPTPALIFALLGILAFGIAFRWWRTHGDAILERSEDAYREKRPSTFSSAALATIIEYVRRVRPALDWFGFLLVLRWLWPAELDFAGFKLVGLVAFFVALAWLGARFADELARGKQVDDPRAEIRWRSLKLITAALFSVLLVLAFTNETVGKGAIYNWVLRFCWLAAIPLALVVSHWWRERIVALSAAGGDKSPFLAWVAKDRGGIFGLLGRLVAGVILLAGGARTVVVRRFRDFALVRELVEQRNRTKAALQVAQDRASGIYSRPDAKVWERLDPHRSPERLRTDFDLAAHLQDARIGEGNAVALIGERGLGKSAVLRDFADRRTTGGSLVVRLHVDETGYCGLLDRLAAALGCQSSSEAAITQAIAGHDAPLTVIADDVQRIVTPAIGGLESLDRLVALARDCGASTLWVLAMGAPAWSYVSRARFDRILFDKVVKLPRWEPDRLRELIERRTAQAAIEPDFGDLLDTGNFQFDADLSADERKRSAYFEKLIDYAEGNPAIAMEFWRRSLFIDTTTSNVVVRTFERPDISKILQLPPNSMFVLRTILQMDISTKKAIERSTDLSPVIVSDALRSLVLLGVVDALGSGFRIKLHWWGEVRRLLQRQNLIVWEV